MEYLKLTFTYIIVGIIFDIPLFARWMRTKDFSDLKDRLKLQIGFILIMLSVNFGVAYWLKIDGQIFNMVRELMVSIAINTMFLFIKKR